jgi:hypothetical protein
VTTQVFRDYTGDEVRLTDADAQHISAGHPEIRVLGGVRVLGETLGNPDVVLEHREALHYYRRYTSSVYGEKYVRVVVRTEGGVKYIRTAHITSRRIRGRVLWERKT